MKWRFVLILFITLSVSLISEAQVITFKDELINADSIRREYDRGPNFGFYKDNYFIFGTSVGPKPTLQNSNVKFQISIQQKLTNTVLPWGTYLYLFYTQKVFWNILEDSMPMTDLNFNPGIGLAKPLFSHKDGRYIGRLSMMLEHESNGKASTASRSWERISFAASILVDPNVMVHAKAFVPILDGMHNRDLLRYVGIFQAGVQYMTPNRRFGASLLLSKRADWNPLNWNTCIELKYRFMKKDNQYFFAQFYNGYAEGLLQFRKFSSELRVGICISPTFFSEY